jgi:hypothetical protein
MTIFPRITVIIPTCNRPEFLRNALESISMQTMVNCVEKVLVSENSRFCSSQNICSEFDSLPIEYIRHVPPIPPLRHLELLSSSVKTELTAILHDDDWWNSSHLENSLEALHRSGAVACFSNILETFSPKHPVRTSHKALRVWAASGRDFSRRFVLLTSVENFLIHFLSTSFHYSTYVGRSNVCAIAARQLLDLGNEYDNDRNFPIILGEYGRLVYVTDFGAYIRIHEAQDCARDVFADGSQRYATNTAMLAQSYAPLANNAISLYNESVRPGLSQIDLLGLEHSISFAQKVALANCGLMMSVPQTDRGKSIRSIGDKLIGIMRWALLRPL